MGVTQSDGGGEPRLSAGIAARLLLISAAVILLPSVDALAQVWPQKTIKIMVGLAPGGPPDIAARIIAPKLGDALAQPVIVENHASAGGIVMMEQVAKASPDGYTLGLVSVGTMFLAKALLPDAPYDPVASFVPVGKFAKTNFILASGTGLPARSLKEFVNLAKAQPGKLNYGASVVGSVPHILAEMFKRQAGVDIVGINYRGAAESMTRFQAGDVQMVFDSFSVVEPVVARTKAIALMVTSQGRSRKLPEVPTASEAGMPELALESWFGLVAPKGTSTAIVSRLNAELVRAVASTDVADAIAKVGLDAVADTPDQFAEMIRNDWPKWHAAVMASGAKRH